jgi:hypothetical protein
MIYRLTAAVGPGPWGQAGTFDEPAGRRHRAEPDVNDAMVNAGNLLDGRRAHERHETADIAPPSRREAAFLQRANMEC